MGGGPSHGMHNVIVNDDRTLRRNSASASTTNSPRVISKRLEKLKVSFKRKSSTKDQIRPFEELIKSWPIGDLNLLLAEFEADSKLLDIQNECDSTRKSTNGFEFSENVKKVGGDVNVLFKFTSIRSSRAFLAVRCKNLKISANYDENPDNFDIREERFLKFEQDDVEFFLKHYIYNEQCGEMNTDVLEELCTEFGCQKKLEDDFKQLWKQDLKNGDLVIEVKGENSEKDNFEIRCSSLIAASRSSIIQSLLMRKSTESPRRLIFSELIFPRAFAALFVCFLYTGRLDWSLAPKSEHSISSLSQAKAITNSGKPQDVQLARALQIIEIARFFEVEDMVQACEDVVVRNLSADNVVQILQWGRSNNSKYISTHAFRFIEREFSKISSSVSLYELSAQEMTELTQSQFLQTTELDLLNACCRWGEHALLKKLEEREPNLVADTCHSISRRGLKKAEKSGDELKEILKPLAENIRKDYALPPFHQDLTDAYNKGILEQSPLGQDLVVCASTSEINPDVHWLKPEDQSTGPRYYKPYHNALLKHRNLKDPISSSPPSDREPLTVSLEFVNLYPDILEENVYSEIKNRITERIGKPDFISLPRHYHRKMALEMITRQTLIALNIPEECISCHLSSESVEKLTPPDVLPPPILPGSHDIF
uniref:BACK domain-containing protein n=1 Tax=Caenorhabditis tropicalis TaxID=1561998 RepID=A0A1I7T5I4_9PELO